MAKVDEEGHGIDKSVDGSIYDGTWKGGERSGTGVMHEADGSVYDGQWKADERHGTGTQHYRRQKAYPTNRPPARCTQSTHTHRHTPALRAPKVAAVEHHVVQRRRDHADFRQDQQALALPLALSTGFAIARLYVFVAIRLYTEHGRVVARDCFVFLCGDVLRLCP
mgnify:CR=1 FL=1